MERSLMWQGIECLSMELDFVTILWMWHGLAKRKVGLKNYVLSVILFLLFGVVVSFIPLHPNIRILFLIGVSSVWYRLLYEVRLPQATLLHLLFFGLLMLSDALSILSVVWFHDLNSFAILLRAGDIRFKLMIASKLLLIMMVMVLKSFNIFSVLNLKQRLLLMTPMIAHVFMLFMIYGDYFSREVISDSQIVNLVFITVLIFLSMMATLMTMQMIQKNERQKVEYEANKRQMALSFQYYEQMGEMQQQLRYVYHDLANHFLCLSRFTTVNQVKAYINDLQLQIDGFKDFYQTGNTVLDILLHEKRKKCNQLGIDLSIQINKQAFDFMHDAEVCTIVANALDNAIEACEKMADSEDKYIDITCRQTDYFCILKVRNSKANDIIMKNQKIQTTKSNPTWHGLGLSSITQVVKKYHGEIVTEYTDNTFELTMMLPVNRRD